MKVDFSQYVLDQFLKKKQLFKFFTINTKYDSSEYFKGCANVNWCPFLCVETSSTGGKTRM